MKVICTQPHDAERDKLAAELGSLRADIKALRPERDEAAALVKLRDEVDRLKREKAQLAEDNDRKIRDRAQSGPAEDQAGPLRGTRPPDGPARSPRGQPGGRPERTKANMKFQRDHFDARSDQQDKLLEAILERLPSIDVALAETPRRAAHPPRCALRRQRSDGD